MKGAFRMQYLKMVYQRYDKSSKSVKGRILDELCRVCGYHRKYAIEKLRGYVRGAPPLKREGHRGHPKEYDAGVLEILEKVWEAADYPWSVRLKEILRVWLPAIKKHFPMTPEMEKKLSAVSPSTIDRALKTKKSSLKRRLYGRTKPGTLLKHQIPIKTDCWDVKQPGFVEVDTVSHSGPNAKDEFLNSVNLTDTASGWVETRAVMGKGERGVFLALTDMREELPFRLVGLDSDNGGEFINYHLAKYCEKEKIQFTRSRPYKKNDNAHIEQKNWTHVRKLLGWNRYDSQEALEAINCFYRNENRLFMNLFQPSVKLMKTIRRGSQVKKTYDVPKTPLDRLLLFEEKKKNRDKNLKLIQLKVLRKKLDPFLLSAKVNQSLREIWMLSHQSPHEAKPAHSSQSKGEELTSGERQTLNQLTKLFGMTQIIKTKNKKKKRAV